MLILMIAVMLLTPDQLRDPLSDVNLVYYKPKVEDLADLLD